jgi:ribosomal RNA assembly protein
VEQKTYIKIPNERVGVLVGPSGKTKRRIERTFKVNLKIDSETGDIEITLYPDQDDVSVIFIVQKLIKAIGRGFSPVRALTLIHDDYDLLIMDLEEYVGNSRNAQNRVKGRVIGKGGKSRELLEELTECLISIYGSTISIIGNYEMILVAKEAIEMLLNGAFHKTVWNHLYAYRRKMKKDRGGLWYEQPRRKENTLR